MVPTFLAGEYVLVNRLKGNLFLAGDVVTYKVGTQPAGMGRVVAERGQEVKFLKNRFYINGKPLMISILNNEELSGMGLKNSENLFSEMNMDRRYPILRAASVKKTGHFTPARRMRAVVIKENMTLLAFDNRTDSKYYKLIEYKDIKGKIEGIMYSRNLRRIFCKPFFHVKK